MSRFDFKNMTLESAESEILSVLGTPYGHNMIGIMCGVVEKRFGETEAQELFNEYQI